MKYNRFIIIFVFSLFAIACIIFYIQNRKEDAYTGKVKGVIVSKEFLNKKLEYKVVFNLDDHQYDTYNHTLMEGNFEIGDSIWVRYDINQPFNAHLESDRSENRKNVYLFSGLLFCFAVIAMIVKPGILNGLLGSSNR